MEPDAGAHGLLLSTFAIRLQRPSSGKLPFSPIKSSNIHDTILPDDIALIASP